MSVALHSRSITDSCTLSLSLSLSMDIDRCSTSNSSTLPSRGLSLQTLQSFSRSVRSPSFRVTPAVLSTVNQELLMLTLLLSTTPLKFWRPVFRSTTITTTSIHSRYSIRASLYYYMTTVNWNNRPPKCSTSSSTSLPNVSLPSSRSYRHLRTLP